MPRVINRQGFTIHTAKYVDIPNNTNASWWRDRALRWNMFHCIGLCGTLFFNGYDSSLFNALQSIQQWQQYFGHPSSDMLGLMNSAGFLPGIVASFCADRLGQYVGRRKTVWSGTILAAVGALIISTSISVGMYIAGRVVMGFGTSMALTVAPALLQEIAHPRYRPKIGGLYTSIYYLAAICSASVSLGCRNLSGNNSWRIPCFLQLLGPAVTLFMTLSIPESPRWLAKKGRHLEARKILVECHANGKEDDDLVQFEYHQIIEALADEESNEQTRFVDFLKTSGNRRRLLILLVVAAGTNWVGNGIVSYYLSPILASLGIGSSKKQLQILVGLHIWNLFLSSAAAVGVDRIGRRGLWLGSTIGMLLAFSAVMGLSATYAETGKHTAGVAVIPCLFLFYGAYDIAWTPLAYSYPVEILTFSLRTKGQAIFIAAQTMAVSVNTWVNPILLDAIQWKYYGVYIAILGVLTVVIYLYFPETRNMTIEEIAIIFDGDRALGNLRVTETDTNGSTAAKPVAISQRVEAVE